MDTTIKNYLESVKAFFIDVYGAQADYVYIDEEEDLVNFTGYGHGSAGGIRCELSHNMADITMADESSKLPTFPECPKGYFIEAINSWSFGVYKND